MNATYGLPAAMAFQAQPAAQFQTGIVVAVSPNGLYVAPGGLEAPPVLCGYTRNVYRPILGDVVALLRQGTSWFALGSISGPDEIVNAIGNYSFEEGADNLPPPGWTLASASGSPTFTTLRLASANFLDGSKIGSLNAMSATSINASVYSDAVPVEAQQRWGIGGYYRTNLLFGANAGTIRMWASWYSDSTFGSLITEESITQYLLVRGHVWQVMAEYGATGNGCVAPENAKFLRVRIQAQWTSTAQDAVYLDRITARRIA